MVQWKSEWKKLAWLVGLFLACFYLPVQSESFRNSIFESFKLIKWYAREHILLCLLPAFFIAGAIAVFVKQASVMKYLGAKANKVLAYGVASVSGTILAVCSCTVLPLFAGIYRMGAGLGPACAFLYSGPAINVLAIILTATVLGPELGIARAVGAISFSVVIGLAMHVIFRKEESKRIQAQLAMPEDETPTKPLWQTSLYFFAMVGVLVFANWGAPRDFTFTNKADTAKTFQATLITSQEEIDDHKEEKKDALVLVKYLDGEQAGDEAKINLDDYSRKEIPGFFTTVRSHKWKITSAFAVAFAIILIAWFKIAWWKVALAAAPVGVLTFMFGDPRIPFAAGIFGLSIITNFDKGQAGEWFSSSWTFTKQIIPLLIAGVIAAGFLLGRPHTEGIIPAEWVQQAVGGNSFQSNFLASVAGAFMYFATLTEVPILQGLIGNGMGKGPALALLLAGPALSLPNMLVIRSVMGTKKTAVYVSLVVVMATISGMIYGTFF